MLLTAQIAFAQAESTTAQPDETKTFQEWIDAARKVSNQEVTATFTREQRARTAAKYYSNAAGLADESTMRYWALGEAGKELSYATLYTEAIAFYSQAEKVEGIVPLARFDAALQSAYATLQLVKAKPGKRDFAPAYAAYRRIFQFKGLEPFHRKLVHGGIATVYSNEGKHLQAALEYEKGEKLHAATDAGYLGAAIDELEIAKPDRAALPVVDRLCTQIMKRKVFDSKKYIYRAKNPDGIESRQSCMGRVAEASQRC